MVWPSVDWRASHKHYDDLLNRIWWHDYILQCTGNLIIIADITNLICNIFEAKTSWGALGIFEMGKTIELGHR